MWLAIIPKVSICRWPSNFWCIRRWRPVCTVFRIVRWTVRETLCPHWFAHKCQHSCLVSNQKVCDNQTVANEKWRRCPILVMDGGKLWVVNYHHDLWETQSLRNHTVAFTVSGRLMLLTWPGAKFGIVYPFLGSFVDSSPFAHSVPESCKKKDEEDEEEEEGRPNWDLEGTATTTEDKEWNQVQLPRFQSSPCQASRSSWF